MMSYAGVDLPVVDAKLADWVEKNISPAFAFEFDPGVDDNQLQCIPIPEEYNVPPVRPGVLAWPTGASRWGVFHTVVNNEQLDTLRAALATGSKYGPSNLVIDDGRTNGIITAVGMTMIPPKPLSGLYGEIGPGGQLTVTANDYREKNKLWLVTLVDDRFWWWFKQPSNGELNPHDDTNGTWHDYMDLIFGALGLATPTFSETGYPLPKSRWHLFHRPLPLVLDAAAYTIGKKVVRKLDGTVLLQSWTEALTQVQALAVRQYAPADPVTGQRDLDNVDMGRIAGGMIDYEDLRRSVPAAVRVVWSDRDNASFNDATLAGLSISQYLSFTGRSGEVAVVRVDDLNSTEQTTTDSDPTTWNQAGTDWYGWRLANWDVTFGGVAQWDGCGWQDYVYWSQSGAGFFTRVTKPPVVNGAGRGLCGAAGTFGLGFFKITGNDGGPVPNTKYSAVEVDLNSASPDTVPWPTKPGGATIPQWKGHRAYSKDYDPPVIPNDQVVLARPSATKPGEWLITPWGGQLRVNDRKVFQVCVRCIQQLDGTFKLRTRTVYRHERWEARDLKRSLGQNTDVETFSP